MLIYFERERNHFYDVYNTETIENIYNDSGVLCIKTNSKMTYDAITFATEEQAIQAIRDIIDAYNQKRDTIGISVPVIKSKEK